jgi:hypothetical protein
MSAAVGKVTSPAVEFGFVSQVVMSLVPAVILIFIFRSTVPFNYPLKIAAVSLVDNGFSFLSFPLYVSFEPTNVSNYSAVLPLTFDWVIGAMLALTFYIALIWFALGLAAKTITRSLVTPST